MAQPADPLPLRHRVRRDLRARGLRLRLDAILAAQAGTAAGLSWFVALDVLGHEQPFFAPIAAVVVLGAAAAQRWRRAIELVFGVALGIAVGDALILAIGVGPVQLAAVVALAILAADVLGGGAIASGQAASSAVLVATLAPPQAGIYFDRFFDALVGGVVGLLVMNLLLPFNPLTRVRNAAGRALDSLASALDKAASALDTSRPELAEAALEQLRATDREHVDLRDSLAMGRETATLAPLRWNSRPALARYAEAAVHIDRATRNARVMQRRITTLLDDEEPRPPALSHSLRLLGEAVTTLRRELAAGRDPIGTPERVLEAVRTSQQAYAAGVGFSGSVVVAQLRSAATDLLSAVGMDHREASRTVRRASRAPTPPGEVGGDG